MSFVIEFKYATKTSISLRSPLQIHNMSSTYLLYTRIYLVYCLLLKIYCFVIHYILVYARLTKSNIFYFALNEYFGFDYYIIYSWDNPFLIPKIAYACAISRVQRGISCLNLEVSCWQIDPKVLMHPGIPLKHRMRGTERGSNESRSWFSVRFADCPTDCGAEISWLTRF